MSDSSLETLARAAGIATQWTDAFGHARSLSDGALHGLLDALRLRAHDQQSRQASLALLDERARALPPLITADVDGAFELPPAMQDADTISAYDEAGHAHALQRLDGTSYRAPSHYGYYQVDVGPHTFTLAVAPRRCFAVSDAHGQEPRHAWGLVAQVYALRHVNDGGLGDSRALTELAEAIGHAGADALALSPQHAMSPVGRHYSPYSPSHRGFLNWLHADPAQVLGSAALDAAIRQSGVACTWRRAQEGQWIDWSLAYALRRNVFRLLHEQFAQAEPTLRDDFQRFVADSGEALQRYAQLAARQAQAAAGGETTSWRHWQDDWRNEATAQDFARQHPAAVDFELFLQWLAARCWTRCQQRAKDAGQHIGLIWDLAVGFEPGGGEAWAWREHVLQDLELGAPPDAFNPDGQRWGISSYAPWGLKASGFRPFIELLRANMARGGGIRIDHIIGFQHLWVLPEGGSSTEGGYLRQPLQDLLRLTALESWRHRCIVIGEDLGTVPAGLRDILAARGVLGIDVLLFTRDAHGDFLAPARWRSNAVATTTTHDLPPLAGWREGQDLAELAQAHAWTREQREQRLAERQAEVAKLDKAVAHATPSAHGYMEFLAQTPSPLVLVPLEDALGLKDQPNLPGTVDSHPNWQHRMPENTKELLQPLLQSIGTSMEETLST